MLNENQNYDDVDGEETEKVYDAAWRKLTGSPVPTGNVKGHHNSRELERMHNVRNGCCSTSSKGDKAV